MSIVEAWDVCELERQTRAHNLLEFGWAQSGVQKRFSRFSTDECVLAGIFIHVP